jgi:hypothetical protein
VLFMSLTSRSISSLCKPACPTVFSPASILKHRTWPSVVAAGRLLDHAGHCPPAALRGPHSPPPANPHQRLPNRMGCPHLLHANQPTGGVVTCRDPPFQTTSQHRDPSPSSREHRGNIWNSRLHTRQKIQRKRESCNGLQRNSHRQQQTKQR